MLKCLVIALASLAMWAFPLAHARAAEPGPDHDVVIGAVRSFAQTRHAAVDGRIGIAVNDLAAPGAAPVFVDAMKQASAWSSTRGLRLDALGNVVALAPGQTAQTLVCSGYPAGDYTLLFDGHGTLAADAGSVVSSSAGRIVLRIAPGSNGFHLILRATSPTDYVRNIRLVAPGFEATYAQRPFFPSYVSALQRFAVLRFANWSHARTFVGAVDWNTRSTPAQFNQTSDAGIAPEYMIALANATADDPWFVFPAGATDAYVARFAELVRATLDPRLHPTFEYGDAMWDPRTGSHRYATVAGLAARLTSLVPAAAPAWYASRSAQVFGLVMQEYGYDANRVHRVLAGPLGTPGSAELALTSALLHSPAARLADAFAVSNVFDPSIAFAAHAQSLTATATVIKAAHLPFWSYETDALAVPIATGRAQYDALFAGWHAVGGGLTVTSTQGPPTKWMGVGDAMASYPSTHLQPLAPSLSRPASVQSVARVKRASGPTPKLTSTAITIVQNSGVQTQSNYGTFALTLPTAPANGDLLIGIMELTVTWQTTFPPPGWTVLDNTNGPAGGHFSVVYATVGSAGVPAATSYPMATVGGGIGELLDISGQSSTIPPIAAADPSAFLTTVTRSLTIPAAGGMAITVAGVDSNGKLTSLVDTLPKTYTESTLVNALNALSSEGNSFSLKTNLITQDVHSASQPFTFTTTATATVGSFPNASMIWIAAASGGSTPTPTPTVTPTPPATPKPTPTPTPKPSPTPTPATSITIAQNSGVQTRSTYGTFSLTLPTAPANGDALLGIMEVTGAWQSAFPPLGWTVLDDANGAAGGHISIVYATVGSPGVPAATSYAMATVGGGVGELLEIRGQSATIAPIAATDPSTYATTVTRSLTIPAAGGLAITAGGLFSIGAATSLVDTLPATYTESNLVNAINGLSSEGNTFSLKTSVIPQDVYGAGHPFTFKTTAVAGLGGFPNSTLVWIAPSGASTPQPTPTPVPTPTATPSPTAALNTWPMYGYDSAHDGYNPNSQLFTAANVANLHLGWQASIPDYLTQTQPIVATNVGGHAGLLFVGGGSGAAYAYDALTGSQVWHTPSFGQIEFGCYGTSPTVGISGTAAYDPSSNSVYFVDGANAGINAPSTITLYQLNAATGAVRSSVTVNPGNLAGEVDYAHTGLTLANGMLYFGTGSTCDVSSWRGRLAAVNVGAMSLANTFFTVYNQGGAYSGGGVWSWGGAAIDALGKAYVGVGNADYNKPPIGPQPPFVPTTNEQAGYGEHLVQLSGDLSTVNASYAVPYAFTASANDLDLSGTPVVYTPLGCPQLVAVQGKAGLLNIYNASTIGSGPLTSYQFSEMVGDVSYIGNGAYSPITGLYYANVPTSQGGSIRPPGMVAIGGCTPPAIQWSSQFGADSYGVGQNNGATRSAPTVTAGNVVFVATPTGAGTGQVWAIDATSGAVLNGGQPILTTGNQVLMPPVVDGEWLYVIDQGGNLYGLTLQSGVPAIKAKMHHIALPRTHER